MSPNVSGICEVSLCEIWASVSEPHVLLLSKCVAPKWRVAGDEQQIGTQSMFDFSIILYSLTFHLQFSQQVINYFHNMPHRFSLNQYTYFIIRSDSTP